MNDSQYRKACRYRVQETLENLAGVWQVSEEHVDDELIAITLDWLGRMAEELHYFDAKIATASSGPPEPGFTPEKN